MVSVSCPTAFRLHFKLFIIGQIKMDGWNGWMGQQFDEPENMFSVLARFSSKKSANQYARHSPVLPTRFRHRRTNAQRCQPANHSVIGSAGTNADVVKNGRHTDVYFTAILNRLLCYPVA